MTATAIEPKHRLDAPPIGDEDFRALLRTMILEEAGHILNDVEFRLGQIDEWKRRVEAMTGQAFRDDIPTGASLAAAAVEGSTVTAPAVELRNGSIYNEDIISTRHAITGYTYTANSPSVGSIAWTDVHIVYNGTDYTCANGNTANRFVYFVLPASGTTATLQTSATKPTQAQLGVGGTLVFVNNAGVPWSALENVAMAGAVADGAVDSGAIIAGAVGSTALGDNAVTTAKINAGAVTSTELGSGAVTAGKVANGAINASAQIANGVVGSGQLGTGAVTAGKVADGAINASAQIANGIVGSGQLGTGAVTAGKVANGAINASAQIANGIVGSTQLGDNAVTTAKINAGAVTSTELGANAVVSTKIALGAVGSTQLGSGAVTPVKTAVNFHQIF